MRAAGRITIVIHCLFLSNLCRVQRRPCESVAEWLHKHTIFSGDIALNEGYADIS